MPNEQARFFLYEKIKNKRIGQISVFQVIFDLTIESSIFNFPTSFPLRSLGWLHSISSEPCNSTRTTSSFEILARPEGSFGLDEKSDMIVMGISILMMTSQ